MIITKPCLYCQRDLTGISKRKYCNVLCRSRAAYHRFTNVHPDKKTKPVYLQRWYAKRAQASQKGLTFELTDVDYSNCLSGGCFYCDEPATTIDRYDNSLGYISSNSVGACRRCNSLKGILHGDVFKQIMDAVSHVR